MVNRGSKISAETKVKLYKDLCVNLLGLSSKLIHTETASGASLTGMKPSRHSPVLNIIQVFLSARWERIMIRTLSSTQTAQAGAAIRLVSEILKIYRNLLVM